MFAAAGEGVDLARLLLDLLIVVAVARVAAEAAERVRLPAVLGEIAAGVIIGPSALGLVELTGERGVSLGVVAEIGVLLLLLQVGMEMDIGELRKVGTASMLVAVIGVALPFAGGAIAGVAMGEATKTAIFLGAALTATSVGITARVFGDLRALATTEARVVLGAAVADDVLGLVILTVVVKVVTGGSVGAGTIVSTLGLAVGFLALTGIVGLLFVPKILDLIHRRASSGATVVVAAFALTLAFAELADAAKLAFIIGAFMAGLALGTSDHHERVSRDLGAIGNILIPVFFVQIGINADLGAMTKASVLGLAAVLTVIGVLGKLAAAWGAIGTRADRLLIGIGMIPRGEVGLIFASIGLANGVLDTDLYGALLVMVLVTTVITPPLLRMRIGAGRSAADEAEPGADIDAPAGGWLDLVDGEIILRAEPPVSSTVAVALHTASWLDAARPSDELLDWFGRHRLVPLRWSPGDTSAFLDLLRWGDTRMWRFLEATAVLERALPEVAAAMVRRRSDVRDLDPLGSLRFPIVEALRHLTPDGATHDDELLIAALAIDVCDDAAESTGGPADLATRLGRVSEADRIASLVADAHLLRHGSARPHVFGELELLQLATHLANPTHARHAHTLALAIGDLPTWHREALEERFELVLEALDHPELTGVEATSLAAARMRAAQRVAANPAAADRLRHASTAYLLSHDPAELARQAQLVEPLPRAGVVRVAVSPSPEPDHWVIDVACRDLPGLLGRMAGALAEAELDVVSAAIATWVDGAVLDTFTCRSPRRPAARALAESMERWLHATLPAVPVHDLTVDFDNGSLPWHTVCIVQGPDQPGALQAVSSAFAAAGIAVHSARISSSRGTIIDRFSVSDRVGRKLDEAAMERARAALAGAVAPRRRLLRLGATR
ncbi:MAG: cation:proton antiporter [Ilumatobacteraceae bacterium]